MTNIARHAKATHVNVKMISEKDHFSLNISDNGIGFEPEESLMNASLGILGMNERAISIGGHIVIQSSPGNGTNVSLFLKR